MIRLSVLLFCAMVGALLYYANRDVTVSVRFIGTETIPLSVSNLLLGALGLGFAMGIALLLPGWLSARLRLMAHRRGHTRPDGEARPDLPDRPNIPPDIPQPMPQGPSPNLPKPTDRQP